MNGGNLLDELQKQVDYANATAFDVHVTSSAGSGSYKKGSGDKKVKVGDYLEIEYSLHQDYFFSGWKVTSENGDDLSDHVEFSPANELKTTVKFLKEGNLYITPMCTKNPGMADYEPKYNWLGVACDTEIKITFNTLIDAATLTQATISITDKNTGLDYFSYFTISTKEEDNVTFLTLKPDNSIKELFTSVNDQIDISVTLNKEAITVKGNSNIKLMGTNSWNYRINSGVEQVLPVIKEVKLYKKAPDQNGKFDEQFVLTPAAYSQWEDADFSKNHFKDLYLYIKGYDADSGLDYVKLTGDLIKAANGEDVEKDSYENMFGSKEEFSFTQTPDENGNYYYEYYTAIDFTEQFIDGAKKNNLIVNDGLVKLDFSLADRAGNFSETKTFYAIKDTTVTENRICSYNGATIDDLTTIENITDHERHSVNGIDTVTMFFTSNSWIEMHDPFFIINEKEYYDEIKLLDVKWGYDLNFGEPIEKQEGLYPTQYPDGILYTLKRDENRESYIKISAADSLGNTNTRIVAIPQKCRILYTEPDPEDPSNYYYEYQDFSKNCLVTPTKIEVLEAFGTADYQWQPYSGLTYDNRKTNPFQFSKILTNPITIDPETEGLPVYLKGTNSYNFDNWCITGTNSGIRKCISDSVTAQDSNIPQKIQNITSAPINKNEGFVTITVEFSNYTKNDSYEYVVGYKPENITNYQYSASTTLSIPTGVKYKFKPFICKDGMYLCHSQAIEIEKDFSGSSFDNTPPKLSFEPLLLHEFVSAVSNYVELYPFTDTTGIYNKDGNYEIEYWFIPNPTLNSAKINCTEEYLYNYKSNPDVLKIKTTDYPQLVYDSFNNVEINKSGRLIFPLDDLPEFSYTLFAKVTDSSDLNNYTIYSNYACNVLVKDDGFKFDYDAVNDEFLLAFNHGLTPEYQDIQIMACFESLTNNKWVKNLTTECLTYENENVVRIGQEDYSLGTKDSVTAGPWTSDSYSEYENTFTKLSARRVSYNQDVTEGYYYTQYVYPTYYKLKDSATPIVCKNKGMLTLDNGVQIFTDNPVLVHTFYCSSNLGENDDLWLNHGIETGIVTDNSDFTYFNDYLKDIPAGKYYKTFVHFADGTQLSTKVKTK